jgi:plastocyanin
MTQRLTMRSFAAPLALALTTALGLVACGGGGGGSVTAPADADLVVEALDGNKFDLSEYSTAAGDVTIAYLGRSAINHTLLVTSADGTPIGDKLKVTNGQVDEGTYALTAGSYTLLCDVPGHQNMKATLVVN